jgi:hypothetical protein
MRARLLALLLSITPTVPAAGQTGDGFTTTLAVSSALAALHAIWYTRATYAGRDSAGVPRYVQHRFTAEERRILLERFGIEDPSRLYLSDTSAAGYLVYDTERDPGARRLVRTYRVGAPSIRRAGESWEALERRVRTMSPDDFPADARTTETSLGSLHPAARPHFARMLAAAGAAGHRVRVVESYRSPERQAYLMALGGGLTFTATSMHSAGRAVDVVVGDGDLRNAATRAGWVAFRRWLVGYDAARFRLIGTPGKSWDWPHVELADAGLGYGSVEALLLAARAAGTLHSSHDPARSGAAALSRPGSGDQPVRLDGAPGGAALSAR